MEILSEYYKKLIEDISKITLTNYEIVEDIRKYYYIDSHNLLAALDDLKQEYDHLLEELEDIKNNDDEREFKTWN